MEKLINAIKFANEIGSNVYSDLNDIYNTVDQITGGRLPYGQPEVPQQASRTRMATDKFQSGRTKLTDYDTEHPVTQYLDEVPDKGLLPVPAVNPTTEALATAAKYSLGPLGKQYRILRSPGTAEQLQKQVEAAVPVNGQLIYQDGDPGYEATKFPTNVQGAGIVGQFIGLPQLDNKVVVEEPYDTNRDIDWHRNQMMDAAGKLDVGNTINSAGNVVFRSLGDSGWANKYPRGESQVIGELPPDHPYYRGGNAQSGTRR